MNHIDQHTLEMFALGSTELELSARQIERHLSECSGCRELHRDIEEYYRRAAQSFLEEARSTVSSSESIATREESLPDLPRPRRAGYLSWNPSLLGRLYIDVRRHPAMTGAGALLVGALAWALFTVAPRIAIDHDPAYASLNPGSSKLEVYNDSNDLLWSIPVTGIEEARQEESQERLPTVVVTDIDGDGHNEVVTTLTSVQGSRGQYGSVLAVFEAGGKLRWWRGVEYPARFRGEKMPGAWMRTGMVVRDFDGDGKKEIVCRAMSGRSPSVVLRFNADGDLMGEYWHQGHLLKMVAVDFARSGKTRLLLGGINDGEGKGDFGSAEIVLLNPARILGRVEATTTPGFGLAPSDAEAACIRLPNTPINIRFHSKPGIDAIVIDSSGSRQSASVWWVASVPDGKLVLEYVFGPDLVLQTLRSSDATIRFLTGLQQKGEMTSREINEFLPSLRSGVEYWNGRTWGTSPHLLALQPQ